MRTMIFVGLLVALGLTACADDATSTPAPNALSDTGAPAADVAAPLEPDAGETQGQPDAAEDTGPSEEVQVIDPEDPASPTELGGGILLFELTSDLWSTAGASARFTIENPLEGDGTAIEHGPCVTTVSDPDAPEDPALFGYDAGLVSVAATDPQVTLTPADEGADGTGYTSSVPEDQESLLPAGGALLTIVADGGADIPAFSAVIQTPEPIVIDTPSTGLFANLPDDEDLEVTWAPGNGDAILLTFSPLTASFQAAAGTGLACGAEGDPGSLVVPAAALQAITAAGNSKVAIGLTRVKSATTAAGDYVIPATVTRSSGGVLNLN